MFVLSSVLSSFFIHSLVFVIFSCSYHWNVDMVSIVGCSSLHESHTHHLCHIGKRSHHVQLILSEASIAFLKVFQLLLFHLQGSSMYVLHWCNQFFASSFCCLSHSLVHCRVFPFNPHISCWSHWNCWPFPIVTCFIDRSWGWKET